MSHCVSVGVSALPAPTPFSCSYLIKSSLRQWRDPHSRKSESTLYGSTRNRYQHQARHGLGQLTPDVLQVVIGIRI